jgi:2-methylfumaryl-CoA isomerase
MQNELANFRVIEHSAFVAAPLAGMSLRQMGADVIRIDPIDGALDGSRWPITKSGASLYWAGLNKGKKSILIDLRSEKGQEIAGRLVAEGGENGGIFLTNLGARGWGSYDSLRKIREDVIVAALSGHPDGTAAVDYTVNCATGLPFLNAGASSDAPVNGVLPAWDVTTGLTLAMGILAAERHRRFTGQGQLISLALSDVAFTMMGNLGFLGDAQINGNVRAADGNAIYGAYGADFGTSDGRRVMVTTFTLRHWKALCKSCEISGGIAHIEKRRGVSLDLDAERYAAREEISALVAPWVGAHSMEEVRRIFDANGVCWGLYQDYGQLSREDARCSPANPVFREVNQPGIGTMTVPGTPIRFGLDDDRAADRSVYIAPSIGENTDQILSEVLRLSAGEIGKLHDERIVANRIVR